MTIPRHSFIAVGSGAAPLCSLAGKDVIIGATAIELGDRYNVPAHGVIPGVIIQPVAAETLIAGVPADAGWPLPLILGTLATPAILAARRRRVFALRTAGAVLAPVAA
ncbi:CHASE2 domain-containing protein [Erythrobacter sp. WG]|uniref:CHASE2 domain-containing protein n=1 Tax=Erythrobacter sp. WG TaxID=2985510 RepID=UPI00226ECDE4|nr:CHASE2 domain-containing protein [Erythrobacter sp. WG]MCX9148131.1 CHASE2 domain-containing protein [Erythrobacter sp. WG]